MRSDMTIPIARLVANRYATAEPPFRLCYLAQRLPRDPPQRGQMREFTPGRGRAGRRPRPGGHRRGGRGAGRGARRRRARRAVIGLGDAELYRQLLEQLGVGRASARRGSSTASRRHDHVGLEAEVGALDLGAGEREMLIEVPMLRGGPEVLERARGLCGEVTERATSRLAATLRGAARARRRRPRPARPRAAARPRLLHRGDPRGLRPGARPHPRRRRALRRAHGPLRPPAAARRASRSTSSACTSPRRRRSGSRAEEPEPMSGVARPIRPATTPPEPGAATRLAVRGHPRPARPGRGRDRRAARRLALAGVRDRSGFAW